jgi:WD40 repeat protein
MTPAMPRLAPQLVVDEQNPWPGLSAFDEAAERFFNGRREESAALRRLAMHAPLTVLFGASGLGKTSLVKAGLFPLLRKDVLPVYVRLDFTDGAGALIEQVKAALLAEIERRQVDAPAMRDGETLWEFLHRAGLEFWSRQNQLLTPLFVFDQFEEVFTLGAARVPAVERLRTDLADLIENRVPAALAAGLRHDDGLSLDSQRYKVLLSFREDFLPQMEGWKRDVPSIMRNRLRLLPMTSGQAFEAVHTTAPHLAPEAIAQRIVAFVAAAGNAALSAQELAVEPALLSLVCHGLNERRKQRGKAQFDDDLLTGTGQAIIADYYATAVAGMPERVQRFIERELITERGFRKPCDIDDARTVHGVTDQELALLVDRRLLRIEPARGTERVELTHDLLTRVVREARDRQRLKDREAKAESTRRRFIAIGSVLGAIVIYMGAVSYYAFRQRDAAQQAAVQLERKAEAARVAEAAARESASQAKGAQAEAETARIRAENQTRAALSHQFAGAALAAVKDDDEKAAIQSALQAIEATREDKMVFPDAEAALRRAVASSGQDLQRPGHNSEITRIMVSPDGRRVATFGSDHTGIWDVAAQEEILRYRLCPEISADWKRLVCGEMYGGYDFMELGTGKVLRHVTGIRGIIFDRFAFGPRDAYVLWGSDYETSLADGPIEKKFNGRLAALSPDGKILATILPREAVKLWDTASGKELYQWAGAAMDARFDPAGKVLAIQTGGVSGGNLPDSSLPGVFLWDFVAGRTTKVSNGGGVDLGCFIFSPNGSRVAALFRTLQESTQRAWMGSVHLLDPFGTSLLSWSSKVVPPFQPTCSFTPDGTSLIVVGFKGRSEAGAPFETKSEIWDLKASPPRLRTSRDDPVAAWDRAGEVVATASNSAASVTNVVTGATADFPSQHEGRVDAAAFSPDAKRLATAASDRRVRIWDAVTGARLLTLIGHESPVWTLAFSRDGNLLVSCSSAGEVKLWNALTGQLVRDLPRFPNRILAVAFTPDGKRIIASGYNDHVGILDVATGADISQTWPAKPVPNVFGVAFSGDGKRLGLSGKQVSILDSFTLRELQQIPGNVGTATGGLYANRDGSVWAAADSNGVRLWTAGQPWRYLAGSRDGNSALAYQLVFSRDGKRLVTPGTDNTIRIWDTATAKEVATLHHEGSGGARIKAVTYSPDERQIYAVGDGWIIYRFPVSLDDLMVEAKKRLK